MRVPVEQIRSHPEVHAQRDEAGLRTVVQIALDTPDLRGRSVDRVGPGGRQVGDPALEGPEPEGFRVAGFLREDALVVHGSLRRWDRLHGEDDRVEDRIVDAPFANRRTIDLG